MIFSINSTEAIKGPALFGNSSQEPGRAEKDKKRQREEEKKSVTRRGRQRWHGWSLCSSKGETGYVREEQCCVRGRNNHIMIFGDCLKSEVYVQTNKSIMVRFSIYLL